MQMPIWVVFVCQTFTLLGRVSALFKLTNIHCESFDLSMAVYNECRLRAITRDITELNLNITLLHPAHQITLNAAFFKKYNGYKPFIINYTVDACEFMKKRNNPAATAVYALFKDFSNINHKCPYVGDQTLKHFYPKTELFKIPLPPGDYILCMTWYLHKVKTFITNTYFTFSNEKLF